MSASGLKIQKYSGHDLSVLRDVLLSIYADVYAERLDDPFFSVDRYWERLEGYASRDGFSIALGEFGNAPVGYALGYSLPSGSGWWKNLSGSVADDFKVETGDRTLALTEIMVLESERRRGYAKALHDALLLDRTEERATLLVLPDNWAAQHAYASWGWEKVGEIKPFSDSPTYDSLVKFLA